MGEKQYIITERAHLMCPNMNFGIKARIKGQYDYAKVQNTIKLLMEAHPFLKSVIAKEASTGKLYYKPCEDVHITILEKEDTNMWSRDYKQCTSKGWDVFNEGLLKVIVYPLKDCFDIIFVAHHLLADGRGMLGLMCEFADSYVIGKAPHKAEEKLISSIKDLPQGIGLSFISKLIIEWANRKWVKEKNSVTYPQYHGFEKEFIHNNPINFVEETVDVEKVEKLLSQCRKEGISLNDYLVAEMMNHEHTNRVVVAVDIRKQLQCYREGALGNYATAVAIVNDTKSQDVFQRAKEVSSQIKGHIKDKKKLMLILACYFIMNPELIDSVAISTLGDFHSKAGRFVGQLIFGYIKRNGYSVTNLGNIKSESISEGMFIPPASPANIKTMGVLSVNGLMKKCTVEYKSL